MARSIEILTTVNCTPNTPINTCLMDLAEAEALCANLKRIIVRSEQALLTGDASEGVEQVERWVESYRRGLSAAQKISCSGIDLLKKTRDQLALSLEERLRLDDEGSISPTKEQMLDNEELSLALRRIDRLMPMLEESFQLHAAEQSHVTT